MSRSRFDVAVETFQDSSGMTESEAEVYVLRALDGRSRSEVAEQLEKSESTVDTQHQNAKQKAALPAIDTVERKSPRNTGVGEGEAYEIWFENGARLRYAWNEDRGEIVEATFAADDPQSVHERFDVGGSEDELAEFALESICEYTQSYRDDPEACRMDWSPVFEALTLYKA